jgi:hypothetical protein
MKVQGGVAVSDATNADLSFYCKAYRFAELKRFQGFHDELLVDQNAGSVGDDDIVFVHANYCVTRSVFLPRRIERTPTPDWIEFCQQELKFQIPVDIAEALSDRQADSQP